MNIECELQPFTYVTNPCRRNHYRFDVKAKTTDVYVLGNIETESTVFFGKIMSKRILFRKK